MELILTSKEIKPPLFKLVFVYNNKGFVGIAFWDGEHYRSRSESGSNIDDVDFEWVDMQDK